MSEVAMKQAVTKTITTIALVSTLLVPQALIGQENPAPDVSLQAAALFGNVEAVRQHIEAGSDLNAKDAYGSTALIVATTFGKTEVATALIAAGADTNITNNDGSSALHVAALFCRTEIVKALLEEGADKYLRNNNGSSALDIVAAPFADDKDVYDDLGRSLGPLGLKLDYEQLAAARPEIAQLLRPLPEELAAVDYTPLAKTDWKVSTPAEQGLDALAVSELYLDAAELDTIYGLLVIKHGHLIAEKYFNEGSVKQLSGRQSATKSVTSAMVGVALDQGCLSDVDQKMIDFFPEFADQITDPRKRQITIRELLQMRGGYPWEQFTPPYFDILFLSDNWHWLPHVVDIPLTADPGTAFQYSNLTSHLLAVIVARACDTDLKSYAQERLFSPIHAQVGAWTADADNYNWGWGELYVTARDMAKFGALYLNDGAFADRQIISSGWVRDSLQSYSEHAWMTDKLGRYLRDIGYGYQWWSARAGEHDFDFAWGHGGQLIVLLHDLDMIIVTTADPLHRLPREGAWKFEGAIINVVGKFITSLPKG